MKHAASVRPEPGSNSPLSESLCPSEAKPKLLRKSKISTSLLLCSLPKTEHFRQLAPASHSCSTLLKSCPLILFVVESTGIIVFSYSIFKVQTLPNNITKLIVEATQRKLFSDFSQPQTVSNSSFKTLPHRNTLNFVVK